MSIACNILLLSPPKNTKEGSKSNIAAKFQNALNLHFLPPIGVFWDIENCQVPKGKSAIALVQNIREKFFANHREAEFMCVCDINKESKTVIQELILAQVTVVHISATSKNAADDKLKQCMRRFVDTHGAPSTLLLISDDVNFSSDLSDFRHRHNIRIILLHRGRTHQSLLACAHEHYEFASIAYDLPVRSPIKSISKRPNILVVTDLPTNRNISQIKTVLKKLSENCGGKVSDVNGNTACIKFATADAAERAQKRMDKEIVFGHKINVNFCCSAEHDFSYSPTKRSKTYDVSTSSSSSRDSSSSPPRDTNFYKINSDNACKKFDFPPPPVLDVQSIPSWLKNTSSTKEFQPQKSIKNLFPVVPNLEIKDNKMFQLDWNRNKILNHSHSKNSDVSAFTPFKKEIDSKVKYSQKNVGRVSPFVMQDCDKNGRTLHSDSVNIRRSNSIQSESTNSYLYSNHNFSNQTASTSYEVQRVRDPVFYQSTWNGSITCSDPGVSVSRNNPALDNSSFVELHVSNLDPTFEINEMKKILLSVFREHVMVLHISMCLQPDGSAKATVKVPSLQDAQYAISRLHRKKIGHKRILISHVSSDKSPPFHVLKSETVALLNDIPNKSLPLIKFRELYEKRYHRPIAVSELYKMREAVTIQGDSGSRIVYLNTEYCNTPSLPESEDSQEFTVTERPYCEVHFHVSSSQGWAEQYNICPLPLVHISLKVLATGVHTLLDSHQGSLPLISFCDCYEAEIGPLPIVGSFENVSGKEDSLEVSSGANTTFTTKGVPLEHLIACIAGVEVAKSVFCIKKVQWLENKIDLQVTQNFSPALLGQLTLFGREVMDLLKNQPQCLVQFNKFIPTYHHHFGRQCRVADYGFTKLIDLLEAIPHIVQVLGEGQNRQVTLTHRTQVKRFAAELLRILKSRASKQITVSEFPLAYEQVIEKPFEITNYGVCEIEDMLHEVPENVIVTSGSGSETIISIPKREQTPEEIERTKQFAEEVVELMKHTTNCTMAFNKFIPAYHHHFGKQCRVADYGFTKLIELFEVIPSVLDVTGTGEDKILKLVECRQHKILEERLIAVLMSQKEGKIDLNELPNAYAQIHGHILRPSDFGFVNLTELIMKFKSIFKIVPSLRSKKNYVYLINPEMLRQISLNLRRLLMEHPNCKMSIEDARSNFQIRFCTDMDVTHYLKDLTDFIQILDGFLQLTPLQLLAKDIIVLLQENGGHLPLSTFSSFYQQRYKVPLSANNYGFQNMFSLLDHLSDYFVVKGKRQKRIVSLNLETAGCPLPGGLLNKVFKPLYTLQMKPSMGVLSHSIPSCIPATKVEPQSKTGLDLMGFEIPPKHGAEADLQSKSEKENVIPSIARTSEACALPSTSQYCSFASSLSYTAAPFEFSEHLPQFFSVHNSAAANFISSIDSSILPVIDKNSILHSTENSTKILKTGTVKKSSDRLSNDFDFEYLQNLTCSPVKSSQSYGESSSDFSPCDTKENENQSSKDNRTNEIKQQNRRKRIAATFSSPIND